MMIKRPIDCKARFRQIIDQYCVLVAYGVQKTVLILVRTMYRDLPGTLTT